MCCNRTRPAILDSLTLAGLLGRPLYLDQFVATASCYGC